jgi:hypothetical protein
MFYEKKNFRGQTDNFSFKAKSVGLLVRIALGHTERDDAPLRSRDGREASWLCQEIIAKDLSTDTSYIFPVNTWVDLNDRPLECELGEKSKTAIAKTRKLENQCEIQCEIAVATGNDKGAGTGKTSHFLFL